MTTRVGSPSVWESITSTQPCRTMFSIVIHIVYIFGYIVANSVPQLFFGELALECHIQVYSFVMVPVGTDEENNKSSANPN
jgi:hypothetical protein